MQHPSEDLRTSNPDLAAGVRQDDLEIELLDVRACCAILGGSKAVHPSTLYRLIQARKLPKAVKVGGSARWVKRSFIAAVRSLIEEDSR